MTKQSSTTTSHLSPTAQEEARHHHHHLHHLHLHNHHDHPKVQHHQQDARPAVAKRSECTSEDINECADVFIKRFRQQLEIQRLDSIENYQKMLARGL